MHRAYTTNEANTHTIDTMWIRFSSDRLMQYSVRISTEKHMVSSWM